MVTVGMVKEQLIAETLHLCFCLCQAGCMHMHSMHTLASLSNSERFLITQKVNYISTSYFLSSSVFTPAQQLLRSARHLSHPVQSRSLRAPVPPRRLTREPVSGRLLRCYGGRGVGFDKLACPRWQLRWRWAQLPGQYRGGGKGLFGANIGPGIPLPRGPGRLPRNLGSGPRKGGNGGRGGPLGKWWGGGG